MSLVLKLRKLEGLENFLVRYLIIPKGVKLTVMRIFFTSLVKSELRPNNKKVDGVGVGGGIKQPHDIGSKIASIQKCKSLCEGSQDYVCSGAQERG